MVKYNQHIAFKIDDLEFDLKNPRTNFGGRVTFDKNISELWKEDIVNFIKQIAEKGFAKTTTFIIAKEKGKNIVIDGNRRLLSLKILKDPDFIKKYISQKDFDNIKKIYSLKKEDIDVITGVLFKKRKDAEREMAILHLSGDAIKKWKLIRQYRYFQNRIDDGKISFETLGELLGVNKTVIKKGVIIYQLFEIAKQKLSYLNKEYGIYSDDKFLPDKFAKFVYAEDKKRFLGYFFNEDKQKIEYSNEKTFLKNLEFILTKVFDKNISAQIKKSEISDILKSSPSNRNWLNDFEYKKQQKDIENKLNNGQGSMFPVLNENSSNFQKQNPEIDDKKVSGTVAMRDWITDKEYRAYQGTDKVKYILKEMKLLDPKENSHILMPSLRVLLELSLYHRLLEKKYIQKIIVQYKLKVKEENIERVKKEKATVELKKNWSPSFREMLRYISNEDNNAIDDPTARAELDKLIKSDDDFIKDLNDFIHNIHSVSGKDDPEKYWKKFGRPFLDIIKNIK